MRSSPMTGLRPLLRVIERIRNHRSRTGSLRPARDVFSLHPAR